MSSDPRAMYIMIDDVHVAAARTSSHSRLLVHRV
jgi:hypothetical protein